MNFTIFLDDCIHCKECCKSIPVCVCDYRIIKAILSKKITENVIKQLRIYQIREEMIDYTADIWWYFPDDNLLKCMTFVEEGFYNILTIPRLRRGCPFLSKEDDMGCIYSEIKPYNCALYPYYQERGEFKISSICKYSNKIDLIKTEKKVRKISELFVQFCIENREKYFEGLKQIQEQFKISQMTYRSY